MTFNIIFIENLADGDIMIYKTLITLQNNKQT